MALSKMEAEFIACSATVQKAVWLKRFLENLAIVTKVPRPVIVYCDSQTTIAYVKDPKYHERTKHIDINNNFIRVIIVQKQVILQNILTNRMVDDQFTKAIPRDIFLTHRMSLGLCRM